MKRRLKSGMLLLLCGMFLFSGCGKKPGVEFKDEVNVMKEAVLTVQEGSITPSGLVLDIDNQAEEDLSYGQDYSIQKEEDGTWYELETEGAAVTSEILWVPSGTVETLEVNWADAYGELKEGHYRIVKNLSNSENTYLLAAEFDVK